MCADSGGDGGAKQTNPSNDADPAITARCRDAVGGHVAPPSAPSTRTHQRPNEGGWQRAVVAIVHCDCCPAAARPITGH